MKKKGLNMEQKRSLTGWAFLLPAALLIFVFCFYPMVQALILSFQKGTGSAVQPAGFANYARILKDATFQQCLFNTIFYFVIQVPIMLILALILAQLLNSPDIKGKGIYRTMIFLPCATSLVSYSMIFKSLFANDGLVNRVLSTVGIPTVDWFQNAWAARWVIVIALVWRWTGYNMVFYLAGLQNIDYSIYEAARIDGANNWQTLWKITIPNMMSSFTICIFLTLTNGFKLFDQNLALTGGRPFLQQPDGSVIKTTEMLALNIYSAFYSGGGNNRGVGQAKAVVFFILVAAIGLLQLQATRKKEVQQ